MIGRTVEEVCLDMARTQACALRSTLMMAENPSEIVHRAQTFAASILRLLNIALRDPQTGDVEWLLRREEE